MLSIRQQWFLPWKFNSIHFQAYFLSDPTIDVELGSTINAMLHSTGYRNDFHCAISEVMSSFKFIRSFKKDKETVSRKKSRIKRRSTSKGFFDIRSESVSSSKSNQSLLAEHQRLEGKMNQSNSSTRKVLFVLYFHLYYFIFFVSKFQRMKHWKKMKYQVYWEI